MAKPGPDLILRVMAVVVLICAGSSAHATKPPAVQFVNVAPLPGAGFALNSQGKIDGQGALQVNIPIAYTPGAEFVNVGAFAGEYTRSIDKTAWNNGTGVVGLGFFGRPRVYASGMAVSTWFTNDSKALSFQIQVTEETGTVPAIAVGAQDVLDKEAKEFGSVANTGVSYYGVMTKRFSAGSTKLYGSLGYGVARFENNVFYGVSWPLNDRFSIAAENDGFQFNTGVAWRPWGRYSRVTLLAGYNGECGPLVGIQFTGKMASFWGIPVYFLMQQHG